MNVREDDNIDDKNVSNRRTVKRERYISSIEANKDLQSIVKKMAAVTGLSQKDIVSKAILNLSVEIKAAYPDMERYLFLLDESAKLVNIEIKPKIVRQAERDQIIKFLGDYIGLSKRYNPNEFLIALKFLKDRRKFLKENFGYKEEELINLWQERLK